MRVKALILTEKCELIIIKSILKTRNVKKAENKCPDQEIKEKSPDLILLVIILPHESGFSNVPIIFVTSCSTDMDELNSIMLGG